VAVIAMSLQDRPLVPRSAQLTPQDIERAKRVVDRHDPRKAGPGRLQSLTLDEGDLNLALNYAVNRLGNAAVRTVLRPGAASVEASLELPGNPFGRYLNIDAELSETGALPRVERLEIGAVPVPAALADIIWRELLRRAAATRQGGLAADVVQHVGVGDGRLTLIYAWSDDVAKRARAVLVAPEDQERLRAYQERLAGVVATAPQRVSLATLMPPMFRLALDRGAQGDIVRENRAAIVVLTFHANGRGLGEIVPAAAQWARPAPRTVTLAGRDDFPKHFLISAAIAAEAGSELADVIGVYKEIEDSRRGSGFSFNDIGADRAGTRFGEEASRSAERARRLALAVAAGVTESDFMPDVADLPEFLPEAEFVRRFGGLDGPGYKRMMTRIEARVAALPLLQ
jgi:hypothetical protein